MLPKKFTTESQRAQRKTIMNEKNPLTAAMSGAVIEVPLCPL